MKENIRLAVCFPTYNRPEVVREFIEKHIFRYIEHGFDIFIYDSSEDTQTEIIVREGMKQYSGLCYVKVDSAVHSNMKVYNIFKEFGDTLKYDYLWVCGDAVSWTQPVLDAVCACVHQGYDIIIPNHHDVENIGYREYVDKNLFFLDCAWQMTYYGTTILKVSTMLAGVNWDALIKKYTVPDCINLSHVAFYFEKLSTMDNWKAVHMPFAANDLIVSIFKKASGWKSDTFYVWCHCWPTMINKLPDCYLNKKEVIKKNGVNSAILDYSNLKILRKENILNKEIYRCYKKEWHNLTSVSRLRIWFLTLIPSYVFAFEKKGAKAIMLMIRIKKFWDRFDRVYIYGAGKKAKGYTFYLNEMNLRFEGYLVSDQVDNIDSMENHRIIKFYDDLIKDEHTGIILALNKENATDVLKNKLSYVSRKMVFCEFRL